MKRLMIATLFAALGSMVLQGQNLSVKADIPFEFRAGSTVMPAGEYVVEELGEWLVLREAGGGKHACSLISFAATRSDFPQDARLTFHRYGDMYFLSSVWGGFSNGGRELAQPKLERELAKNRNNRPTTTAILARNK